MTETENERLQRELDQREFEIKLLKETADAVTSELRLDSVLQMVAERACALVHAEYVLIPILSADCSEYTYQAGCGPYTEEIVGQTLPRDYGICGWVWEHRRPWWRGMLGDLTSEEKTRWEQETGSLIMVPLIGKQHFLGGIAAHNKIGGADFDQRDLDILTLFATQCCIAIENAMHYQQLEIAKAEAEAYQAELAQLNQRLAHSNLELEHLALFDPMTNLSNRTLFTDRLQQALHAAARSGSQVGVIMVDLDRFKEVNDTLGHEVGDVLLQKVAERYLAAVRSTDTVGRLGGDEFALVLPDCRIDEVLETVDRLQDAMEAQFQLAHGQVSASASFGIAMYPEHGEDVSTLLKHADVAMYSAKNDRSGHAVYNTHTDPHNPVRLAKRTALRQMVTDHGVELHYQPKVDLASGEIIGAEALARWHHPEWGMVPPDEFIPMLEYEGYIRTFTRQVLELAMVQQRAWKAAGFDLTVAVNLSAQDIRDVLLFERIEQFIHELDFTPDRLILELTESAVMERRESTYEVLDAITTMGVQFSIDDFGTGYSSLSRLKHLPVNELKIDRSFISHMDSDPDDAIIAHSTIDLAHNLGLRVVAEGVESADVLEQLRSLGCDQVQGYFISRPLSVANFTALLQHHRAVRRGP